MRCMCLCLYGSHEHEHAFEWRYTSNTFEALNVTYMWWRNATIKSTRVKERTINIQHFNHQKPENPMYNWPSTTIKRIGLTTKYSAKHYSLSHVFTHTHIDRRRFFFFFWTVSWQIVLDMVLVYNTVFSDVIIIWSFIAFKREASALSNDRM